MPQRRNLTKRKGKNIRAFQPRRRKLTNKKNRKCQKGGENKISQKIFLESRKYAFGIFWDKNILLLKEKLENINTLLTINNKENIKQIKNKIRMEIKNGLSKDKIFNEEDKMLLHQLYLKIKNEFKEIEKN